MNLPDLAGRIARTVVASLVWLVGRPVHWVVRRVAPDLPEPPRWAVPVVLVVAVVATFVLGLVEQFEQESSDRVAEPEPTPDRDETPQSEAKEILGALDTLEVEYPPTPSQDDVRAAYRERAMETHPDQGGDAERFIAVREAWERLPEREELSEGREDERGN